MEKKRVKTTAANLAVYKKEILRYIKLFQLDDWEVHFTRRDIEDNLAQVSISWEGRICTFVLATEWSGEVIQPTVAQMKASAKHEAIELLLVPLRYLGQLRFMTETEYDKEAEGVVRKLENLL